VRPPADERWVNVIVLPGDARAEVDGEPVRRRDGVMEVRLKPGAEKVLKVTRGAMATRVDERPATIQEAAGKPVVVDLNDKTAPGAATPPRFGFDE
jgi:hypothetical protein